MRGSDDRSGRQGHHRRVVDVGVPPVGDGVPDFVIAEIGIHHNGDVGIAKRLIGVAVEAGVDAVKFQLRTPGLCTPRDQWDVRRAASWGEMTYPEHRHRVEFGRDEYAAIDAHCRRQGIDWFASCWVAPSVDLVLAFSPLAFKIASASVVDHPLVEWTVATGVPVLCSTGMSTIGQIDAAVALLDPDASLLLHATSSYPCPRGQLNLRAMATLRARYGLPVGYLGHEDGLATTVAAVALRACAIERASPSIGPCGARPSPPRSNHPVCAGWSGTSERSRRPSGMGSRSSTSRSWRRLRKLRLPQEPIHEAG